MFNRLRHAGEMVFLGVVLVLIFTACVAILFAVGMGIFNTLFG